MSRVYNINFMNNNIDYSSRKTPKKSNLSEVQKIENKYTHENNNILERKKFNIFDEFEKNKNYTQPTTRSGKSNDIEKSYTIDRNISREYIVNNIDDSKVVIKSLLDNENGNSGYRRSMISNGGSVSYTDNFNYENPVMIVRGEDELGYFEACVNIKDIDINNCNFIEMEALNDFNFKSIVDTVEIF